MKISILINDVDPLDCTDLLNFLRLHGAGVQVSAQDSIPVKALVSPDAEHASAEIAKPAKRKRRTKAKIAEDKAAEANPTTAPSGESGSVGPGAATPTSRRRRLSPEAEEEPTSRRRHTPAPASSAELEPSENKADDAGPAKRALEDEISDADVAKAASAAAEILTPDVVMAVLEEFDVDNVSMLDQDARRDFISVLDQKVDDSLPNG